jgi:hypothetical protein
MSAGYIGYRRSAPAITGPDLCAVGSRKTLPPPAAARREIRTKSGFGDRRPERGVLRGGLLATGNPNDARAPHVGCSSQFIPANAGGLHPASWHAVHVANTVRSSSRIPMRPHVSRSIASSSGWACPASVGIDFPQFVHTVRNVGFPSARYALPLVGTIAPVVDKHTSANLLTDRGTLTIRGMPKCARSDSVHEGVPSDKRRRLLIRRSCLLLKVQAAKKLVGFAGEKLSKMEAVRIDHAYVGQYQPARATGYRFSRAIP